MAEKILSWGYDNIGFVVGATKGEDIKLVRSISDKILFLIPGIGAQGGKLEPSLKYGLNKDGIAVINVGRTIIYASRGRDFHMEARKKALEIKEHINKILKRA
jgi:orotidine-5'-phosphate decarboxylase